MISFCVASTLALVRRILHRRGGYRLAAASCSFGSYLFAGFAHAQVITDGSLGAQTSLSGPNYSIDSVLGQQRGANLFHSFATFNVNLGESATFQSASGTANIVARVTGGFGSEINGTLAANANLFLLNPQGILVGANAAINVTGSLHLGTADYVRLGSGSRFYASLSADSVLSSSEPSAFGFLDGAIAPLRIAGAMLNLSNGQTLSLIGGDLALEQADLVVAGGRINLAAAASAGEVVLGLDSLDASAIATRGAIRLDGVTINGPNVEGANIFIRGGQFVMENGSTLSGNVTQIVDARSIDIDADSIRLRNSTIDYESALGAAGTTASLRGNDVTVSESSLIVLGGGDLSIVGSRVQVDSGSSVGTRTGNGGRAGSLSIAADSVTVDAATLTTRSDVGDAGGITIDADSINIIAGGNVVSTTSSAGSGGSVSIRGQVLVIDGTQSTLATGISAGSLGIAPNAGDAGEIIVDVDTLQMRNGFISSTTNGPGQGGDILVAANSLAMEQAAAIASETGIAGPLGNPSAYGDGGSIAINAAEIQMASGARISASTFANGAGGSIAIDAAELQIDSSGAALTTGITANSGAPGLAASGRGGDLSLDVNDLRVQNQGQIASNAYGSGQAGRIELAGNSLAISSGGVISASSFGQGPNSGAANDIDIRSERVAIDDFGQITNSTTGSGDAGRLVIAADQIRIANGGLVQASSLSQSAQAGAVGDIEVTAQGALILSGGSINARSFGSAAPGTIAIRAASMTLSDGAVIAASSAGSADAGSISIDVADNLRLANFSRITTEALQGSGGNMRIVAGNRLILSDSGISTSVLGPAANGGNIFIESDFVILSDSEIIARAVGGAGGGIILATDVLIRDADSAIDASSALGISGRVDIAGLDLDLNADFARLPIDFLSSPDWQASPCAGSGEGNSSQFIVAGRDGAYRSPLDFLQGPLLLDAAGLGESLGESLAEPLAEQLAAPSTARSMAGGAVKSPTTSLMAALPSFASLCLARR